MASLLFPSPSPSTLQSSSLLFPRPLPEKFPNGRNAMLETAAQSLYFECTVCAHDEVG